MYEDDSDQLVTAQPKQQHPAFLAACITCSCLTTSQADKDVSSKTVNMGESATDAAVLKSSCQLFQAITGRDCGFGGAFWFVYSWVKTFVEVYDKYKKSNLVANFNDPRCNLFHYQFSAETNVAATAMCLNISSVVISTARSCVQTYVNNKRQNLPSSQCFTCCLRVNSCLFCLETIRDKTNKSIGTAGAVWAHMDMLLTMLGRTFVTAKFWVHHVTAVVTALVCIVLVIYELVTNNSRANSKEDIRDITRFLRNMEALIGMGAGNGAALWAFYVMLKVAIIPLFSPGFAVPVLVARTLPAACCCVSFCTCIDSVYNPTDPDKKRLASAILSYVHSFKNSCIKMTKCRYCRL